MKKEMAFEQLKQKERAYTLARNIFLIGSATGLLSFMGTMISSAFVEIPTNIASALMTGGYLFALGASATGVGCELKRINIHNKMHKKTLEEIRTISHEILDVKDEDEYENK